MKAHDRVVAAVGVQAVMVADMAVTEAAAVEVLTAVDVEVAAAAVAEAIAVLDGKLIIGNESRAESAAFLLGEAFSC